MAQGATVSDDPTTTDCDESLLLLRKPDGTIQYKEKNTVDPSGINGQSVYNGSTGADRIWGGNDNDTFWGAATTVIEGNGGDDVALGGDGNDIITDLSGADVLKGGSGQRRHRRRHRRRHHDGGDGQDFINGGANDNETFAGPGNDFIIAGQGADAVFGDGGDDWIAGWLRSGPAAGRPRRAVLRRPDKPLRATTSWWARSARTTTTPRVATTSWLRTPRSIATPVPVASTGPPPAGQQHPGERRER